MSYRHVVQVMFFVTWTVIGGFVFGGMIATTLEAGWQLTINHVPYTIRIEGKK